jgi:hypothetical protein
VKISRRAALWTPLALALLGLAAARALVFDHPPDLTPRKPPPDPLTDALRSGDPLSAAGIAHEPRSAARAALTACSAAAGEGQACYERFLERRLAARGVEDAMQTLERLAALDPNADLDGHVYAHGLGIAAYAQDPDLARTFKRCSPIFSSGCYHGVLQGYFEDDRRSGIDDLDAVCAGYKGGGQSRWLLFQCVHGMGHGLNMYRDHDLPRALADCDRLSDAWDRESCYGGALMENIMNATSPEHPATLLARGHRHGRRSAGGPAASARDPDSTPAFRAIDPADPLYPCSIMEDRYLTQCYMIQTAAILDLNGGDVAEAARTCDRAPSRMRSVCYQSLGRDITSYARNDPRESLRMCDLGKPRYRPDCYVGVVAVFIEVRATTEPGFAFCRMLQEGVGKARCYEQVGEEVATLHEGAPERAALCEGAERGHVDACRYGAGLTDRRPPPLPGSA